MTTGITISLMIMTNTTGHAFFNDPDSISAIVPPIYKSASGFAQLPIVSKLRRISKSDGTFKIINTSPISTPTITGLDSFFMISFKDNSCPPSDLEVSNTPSVQRNRLSITTQKENATTATGSNISFTRGSPKNAIFPKRHWAVKIFLLSPRKCNNVPVRNPAPVSSGYVISA